MEEYVDLLGKVLEEKNLNRFAVFPDVKPFKIIKPKRGRIIEEISEIIKKNPEKYNGRSFAYVALEVDPLGFKKRHGLGIQYYTVFTVYIVINNIYKGEIARYRGGTWNLVINYEPDELEKHPFNMKDIEKYIKLANKRKIVGTYNYKEFEKEYNKLKEIKKTKKDFN
jgi:hypothetical protein